MFKQPSSDSTPPPLLLSEASLTINLQVSCLSVFSDLPTLASKLEKVRELITL